MEDLCFKGRMLRPCDVLFRVYIMCVSMTEKTYISSMFYPIVIWSTWYQNCWHNNWWPLFGPSAFEKAKMPQRNMALPYFVFLSVYFSVCVFYVYSDEHSAIFQNIPIIILLGQRINAFWIGMTNIQGLNCLIINIEISLNIYLMIFSRIF